MNPRVEAILAVTVVLAITLACANPLSRFTKQYHCSIAGEPEPRTADDYIKRAWKHNYDKGERECALGACSEAVRLAPSNPNAYNCRADALRLLQRYPEALKDVTTAIKLSPDPLFYNSRGLIYQESGDLNHALEDFTKVIDDSPDGKFKGYSYYYRGRLFESQGKTAQAIEDFGQAIRLQPDDAYNYSHRGDLYFKQGDYDRALADYTEAIRLDPRNQGFYSDRARIYEKMGQSQLASQDLANSKTVANGGAVDIVAPPPSPVPTIKSNRAPISGGVLNGKAISLPKPLYPPIAKQAHASGTVIVQIVVDEQGNVISAHAVSGHPLLQAVSIAAARQAKFRPTLLSGQPVKVTGIVTYNFVAE